MKIAFIGQKGIPTKSGGVERHVEELSTRLAREGHEVTVYGRLSYGIARESFFRGVRVLGFRSISSKNLDAITATFLGVVHIIFSRYDVVHFHGIGPASLAWIIRILKPRTLLIGTFHSADYEHAKWGSFAKWYLHLGERIICTVPHKTIVVSRAMMRYVAKTYGKRAVYIPNGCESRPMASDTAIVRKWGLKSDRYLLSVSRLVKHKGIHFLIEAFKRLEDTNKLPNNFKLVIVGSSAKTDEYVRYLKFIAKGRKNIIFTGEQTGANLRQLFTHAYAFVQPSTSEGLSIALLEAMGYGLAPIVSDIPENIEAVGEAGFVFPSESVDALTEKLAYALNKPQEVVRVGALARRRATSEYDWTAIAKKTSSLYRETWKKVFRGRKSFSDARSEGSVYRASTR